MGTGLLHFGHHTSMVTACFFDADIPLQITAASTVKN